MMSKNHELKSSGSAPDLDDFSFEDYISGVSTFPTFSHTVYLDQANGIALLKIYEEGERIARRGIQIEEQLEASSEDRSRSLVDDDMEKLAEERDKLLERGEELQKEKAVLEEKVKASAMTLSFQVGTAQKLGSVVRQAEKEYQKKHGRGRDDDLEYISGKFQFQLEAQLAAYCTGVTLADGRQIDPPNRAGFSRLCSSLIPSESTRLLSALNENLDSSTEWAEKLDAGFPGGGSVAADITVGDSADQGGALVGGSSPDDADGGSI